MIIPKLAATIERRLLISYAVDPKLVFPLLPPNLKPQLVDGNAVAGMCLIRLGSVRPAFLKPSIGWGGENAAHRIAVEYKDDNGKPQTGVFIPERHSNSILPVLAGGRIFPGKHTKAEFIVNETENVFKVRMKSENMSVAAHLEIAQKLDSSLFADLEAASHFYQDSPVGWSPVVRNPNNVEGLKLSTDAWKVKPGKMKELRSSFFDQMPKDSVVFDHVLVMQDVPVIWSQP